MKGIFLCAYKQRHYSYDIDYNDIVVIVLLGFIAFVQLCLLVRMINKEGQEEKKNQKK